MIGWISLKIEVMNPYKYSNEGYTPIIPEALKDILIYNFLDCIDVIELTMEVEKLYNVKIPDWELEGCCYTIGDFVNILN